jgi:hypothetical protein
VHAALGDAAWADAVETGRALPAETAIAQALQILDYLLDGNGS